jgi:Methyltransferase FkbM domain
MVTLVNLSRRKKPCYLEIRSLGMAVILYMGYWMGRWHAEITSRAHRSTTRVVRRLNPPVVSKESIQGWHTIDVFYGDRKKLESFMIPKGKDTKFAQAYQDDIILALLRNKTNGYFLDLASNDATRLSNTYRLERYYGWRGLCMEPNPMYWSNLTSLRNCTIVGAVIGNHERLHEVYFRFGANIQGGITGTGFDNGREYRHESQPRYTIPLREVLLRFHAPKYIDYMSLDVEGAEEYILHNFLTSEASKVEGGFTIAILTIERPKKSLEQLLQSLGYTLLQKLTNWGETLWAHSSVIANLDLNAMEEAVKNAAIQAKEEARQKRLERAKS